MPILPFLWTGAKWLGGAVVSGLIGEWISDKVSDYQQPSLDLDKAATQIIIIGGLVAIVSYIFTITLIAMIKVKKWKNSKK